MLLRQTRLYLPAQIGAPLVQLASVLIWAHLLPGAELGKLMLVVALQDILFAFCFVWWSHFVLRFLPRFLGAERERFRSTETAVLTLSSILQIVIVSGFCRLWFPDEAGFFSMAAAAFITARALATYGSERARAEGRIFRYTMLQAALPAAGLLLSILAITKFGARADVALLGAALPLTAAFPFVPCPRTGFDRDILKRALSFGLPAMAAALLATLALNLPRFVVDLLLGHAAAGVFAVIYGLGLRASTFAVMLVTAGAYPLAVRRMEEEGEGAGFGQVSANTVLVYLVTVPMALGLAATAGTVSALVLPADMHATAVTLLPVVALVGLFRYLRAHTTDQVFLLLEKPNIIAVFAAAELALTAILTVAATLHYGLTGAVLGPLCAAAAIAALSAARASHSGFRLPLSTLGRIVLAAVLMACCVFLTGDTTSLSGLALHIAAGGLIYSLLLAAFFPYEARSLMQRSLLPPQDAKGIP